MTSKTCSDFFIFDCFSLLLLPNALLSI
ncbi:hypothetical protein F383_17473 [Gossypium arboreum]|uniref:Uncharacterized protein n=1 Tax=Gossypium arboreum TaxID=29729 RepID=A0A0B0NEY8_GOSAR|nr:hypothetical protein F383_17473 [Gossypium arboreum]